MPIPTVFISYSHDSEEHKSWVRRLAEQLLQSNINVIIDAWNLRPGEDLSLFMEKSIASADKVILILTPAYANKLNAATGGVGYERMLIPTYKIKNAGINKFIPILREEISAIPPIIGSTAYIDMTSEESYNRKFRELINSIPATLSEGGIEYIKDLAKHHRNDHVSFHWSRYAHIHFGNTLYFIFIKVRKSSLAKKENIARLLDEIGVPDYSIFVLFSEWDFLVRAWCDGERYIKFSEKVRGFPDNHDDRTPELLTVTVMKHFSSRPAYDQELIEKYINTIDEQDLKDIDSNRNRSKHFENATKIGLLLPNTVRFDPESIQFYTVIRAATPSDKGLQNRINNCIQAQEVLKNRTVFFVSGSAAVAIIKAQVDKYYDISDFFKKLLSELDGIGQIWTETMLVSDQEPIIKSSIDWDLAYEYRANVAFESDLDKYIIGGAKRRRDLKNKYLLSMEAMKYDKDKIILNMLRGIASGQQGLFDAAMGCIPRFEEKLRRNLSRVLISIYGKQEVGSRIKHFQEKHQFKQNINELTIGVLSKIYSDLIDDGFLDIEYKEKRYVKVLLDELPIRRNLYAHNGVDVKEERQAQEMLEFMVRFMELYYRLSLQIDELAEVDSN